MSAGLNLAQQEAVNYMQGPCLVLAGAGSGKTRVITHKIGRLIQAGLEAKRIAAITFTNKAAAEMRERAKSLIGREARDVLICTFHALGVRMLRQDGAALGLKPQFSILDSDDVTGLLKDAGGTTDAATARQWQWAISLWKNMGLNAAQAEAQAKDDNEKVTARIMARYEERLAAYQSVDFDDLIGLPLKLLRDHPQVREKWQAALGHVLVDEYQDTNATQYEVLKLLVGARGRFTAVGDDDQSIYGWRGATLDNLRRLPQDFPSLKVIKLEQNYRSTGAILRAANNVIGPNPKLFPKVLFSELGEGEPVRVVDADHEAHEAERVVARIQSTRPANGLGKDWKDFAVLYRANHQARVFEQALRKAQIPYKVSGGQSFFDRAEIKDLCAWLRLVVNNDDDPAFLRAVTSPKRGIGHQTLTSLGVFAGKYKLSLFEALFSSSLGSVLTGRAVAGLHEFGRYVNDFEFQARHTSGADAARVMLTEWLKDISLREAHLRRRGKREAGRVALDQRAGVLRLDGAALRRPDRRRRRRDDHQRDEDLPAGGADDLAAVDHQRARAGPEHGDPVHPACRQGPGVAARHAGGRDRRPAAVQAGRRQQPHGARGRPHVRRHPAAAAGGTPPDVRGHHPGAALAGRELDQEAQEGPRDDRGAAQPLHRRDVAGDGDDQGRPARKAQGLARRIRQEGRRHGGRGGRGQPTMSWRRLVLVAVAQAACAAALAQDAAQVAAGACPKAAEVGQRQLLGLWRAEFEGLAPGRDAAAGAPPRTGRKRQRCHQPRRRARPVGRRRGRGRIHAGGIGQRRQHQRRLAGRCGRGLVRARDPRQLEGRGQARPLALRPAQDPLTHWPRVNGPG